MRPRQQMTLLWMAYRRRRIRMARHTRGIAKMKFHGEQIGDRFTARLERGPLASAELNSDSFGGLMADMQHAYWRLMADSGEHAVDASPRDPGTVEPSGSIPNNDEMTPTGAVDDGKNVTRIEGHVGPAPDSDADVAQDDPGDMSRPKSDAPDTRQSDAAAEQQSADAAAVEPRGGHEPGDDALPPLEDHKPSAAEARKAAEDLERRAARETARHTRRK